MQDILNYQSEIQKDGHIGGIQRSKLSQGSEQTYGFREGIFKVSLI